MVWLLVYLINILIKNDNCNATQSILSNLNECHKDKLYVLKYAYFDCFKYKIYLYIIPINSCSEIVWENRYERGKVTYNIS